MKAAATLIAFFLSSTIQVSAVHVPSQTSTIAIHTDGCLSVRFSDDLNTVTIDGASEEATDDWDNFTEKDLRQCMLDTTEDGIHLIKLQNIKQDYAENLIVAVCNIANSFTPHQTLFLEQVYISNKAWQALKNFQSSGTVIVKECIFAETAGTPPESPAFVHTPIISLQESKSFPIVSVEMQNDNFNFTLLITGKPNGQEISAEDLQVHMSKAIKEAHSIERERYEGLNDKIKSSNQHAQEKGEATKYPEVDLSQIKIVYTIRIKDIPPTLMSTVMAALKSALEETHDFAIVNWLYFQNVTIDTHTADTLIAMLSNLSELEHFWIINGNVRPNVVRQITLNLGDNKNLKTIHCELLDISEGITKALTEAVHRQLPNINNVSIIETPRETIPQVVTKSTAVSQKVLKRSRIKAFGENAKASKSEDKSHSQKHKKRKNS